MNQIVSFIEWSFWGIWFAALTILGLTNIQAGASPTPVIVLAGLAIGLGFLGWILRGRQKAKFIFNFGLAAFWLLGYFLIGFPNTLRASGERPAWAVILLVFISVLPALTLGIAHFTKKRIDA